MADSGSWKNSMRDAGPHLDLGYRVVTAMLFFGGGGVLVDRWLETEPWLSIVGALLGFVAVIGVILRFDIEERQRKERRQPSSDSAKTDG